MCAGHFSPVITDNNEYQTWVAGRKLITQTTLIQHKIKK